MSTPFLFSFLFFFFSLLDSCSSAIICILISSCQSLSLRLGQFGSTSCRAVAVDDPSLSFAEVPCSSGHRNDNFCSPPKHLHVSYRANSLF